MIARARRWLRHRLLGRPCPLCALPVPRRAWDDHMAWHGAVALAMGRAMPPGPRPPRSDLLRPVRPARPQQPGRRDNGGPT